MPATIDTLIKEGIAALKEGRKNDADRALRKAVELDDQNEQAWLWLSAVVDTPEERQICLENVLDLNPDNAKARKGLEATLAELKAKPAPAPPPPPSVPSSTADSGWNLDEAFKNSPFAGTGFDVNPYSNASETGDAAQSGWGNFETPATSVDWVQKPALEPARRDALQPSEEEYDNWMAGLSLGGDSMGSAQGSTPAFATPDEFDPTNGPFGSGLSYGEAPADEGYTASYDSADANSFEMDANPFDFKSVAAQSNSYGGYETDTQDAEFGDDLLARLDPLPAGGTFTGYDEDEPEPANSFSFPLSPISTDELPAASESFPLAMQPPVLSAKKSVHNPFGGGASTAPPPPDSTPIKSAPSRASSGGAVFITADSTPGLPNPGAYFSQIPDEIQVAGAGTSMPVLVISIIALIILNLGSLLLLITSVRR